MAANFLTRQGALRYSAPTPSIALKPMYPGARILIATSDLTDIEVLVASGRPGRGYIPLRVFNNLPNAVITPPPVSTLPTDPSQITWEGPLATLTGGTSGSTLNYTGRNFRSTNPNVPAVLLDNYSGVVTFTDCAFFGYGQEGTAKGIIGSTFGARVVFINCVFFSGNPMVQGKYPGQAIKFDGFKEITVIGCDFYGTGGIYLNDWKGTANQATNPVTIVRYRFFNIDGRVSNPSNADGWMHGNTNAVDKYQRQMVQLNFCRHMPRVLIQHNYNYNEIGKSRVEDIVSTTGSSGTPDSPIIIDSNLLVGQYIYDWWFNPTTSVYYGNNMPSNLWGGSNGFGDARGYASSGGGGLCGDGAGTTYVDDSAYIHFTNNTVIGMSNYGLGMAACHDSRISGNTILRSGYVIGLTRDVRVAWAHVPIQIQDYNTRGTNPDGSAYTYTQAQFASGDGQPVDDGTGTNTKRIRWYNNDVMDNRVGSVYFDPRNGGARSTTGILYNSPIRTKTGNVQLSDVTRADELAAIAAHQQRWANAGLTIGRTG